LTATTPDFAGWLAGARARVDGALEDALAASSLADAPPPLPAAVRRALLAGGKRVRPALCLLACEAEGGSARAALPAALALECVHAYSLVHDDLPAMDDDALRRGQPTLHVVYGEAVAVLAGDALQALAFELLARQADAALARDQVRLLAEAAGAAGMVGGQALDMAAEGRECSDEAVRAIQERKTGALIAASFACGARAAGADPARWRPFAGAIGRLFQATDDLLDATRSSAEIGKTAGKDAGAGKATLIAAHGLAAARALARHEADAARSALTALAPRARYDELADLPRFLEERAR
jgi:farnesyl diphosphate synthase